jgi:hypothetical protein
LTYYQDEEGDTQLHIHFRKGDYTNAEVLINKDFPVNIENRNTPPKTSLLLAAEQYGSTKQSTDL